jgi:hypothetical protein
MQALSLLPIRTAAGEPPVNFRDTIVDPASFGPEAFPIFCRNQAKSG